MEYYFILPGLLSLLGSIFAYKFWQKSKQNKTKQKTSRRTSEDAGRRAATPESVHLLNSETFKLFRVNTDIELGNKDGGLLINSVLADSVELRNRIYRDSATR